MGPSVGRHVKGRPNFDSLRVFAAVEGERFAAAVCRITGASVPRLGGAIHPSVNRVAALIGNTSILRAKVFTGGGWRIFGWHTGAEKVAYKTISAIRLAEAPVALFAHAFIAAVAALQAIRVRLAELLRRRWWWRRRIFSIGRGGRLASR